MQKRLLAFGCERPYQSADPAEECPSQQQVQQSDGIYLIVLQQTRGDGWENVEFQYGHQNQKPDQIVHCVAPGLPSLLIHAMPSSANVPAEEIAQVQNLFSWWKWLRCCVDLTLMEMKAPAQYK